MPLWSPSWSRHRTSSSTPDSKRPILERTARSRHRGGAPEFCVRGLSAAYGSQISPSGCRVSTCGYVGGSFSAARPICTRKMCDARHAESTSSFGPSRERDQRMSWMLFATSRVLAISRTLGVVSEQPRGRNAPHRKTGTEPVKSRSELLESGFASGIGTQTKKKFEKLFRSALRASR